MEKTLDELKQEATKWWAVEIFTSVMQLLFFWAWIVVLLVAIGAPVWTWVFGLLYASGHTVHYLSWLMTNTALKNWKYAVIPAETKLQSQPEEQSGSEPDANETKSE
jgi:hypothetical protein